MPVQDESLEQTRTKNDALKIVERAEVGPAEDARPGTRLGCRLGGFAKLGPVPSGMGMVLDMVAVVEEKPVIKCSVVTYGAVGMLEVTVHITKSQPENIAGYIDEDKEPR